MDELEKAKAQLEFFGGRMDYLHKAKEKIQTALVPNTLETDLDWESANKRAESILCENHLTGIFNDAENYVKSKKRFWCDEVCRLSKEVSNGN